MANVSRRDFLRGSAAWGAAACAGGILGERLMAAEGSGSADIRFGLVTYEWGKDWDLPTLLRNCAAADVLGVELRTSHAHGVEPSLSETQRQDVKKRFADSPVKLVGLGTVEDFHDPDPQKLAKSIENTKAFIKLGRDVGGSGVKVRPNNLPKGVPQEKTTAQIGNALNVLGAFAADYGQQIRLEVHGGCARLPVIKQIMDVATHPNVGVCWNCNTTDLEQPGLEYNFNLVKTRLGATLHAKPFDTKSYPFEQLLVLLLQANYHGWWLLEAGGKPPADRVQAMAEQKKLFDQLLAKTREAVGRRP